MAMIRRHGRKLIYLLLVCVAVSAVTWRFSERWQGEGAGIGNLTYERTMETEIPEGNYQRYLLLYHLQEDIPEAVATFHNLEMALTNAKLPVDKMTFAEWARSKGDLTAYRDGAVILIGEQQQNLAHLEQLKRYVQEEGGLLVNAMRSPDSPLNAFMGVEGTARFAEESELGLRWTEPVYPGLSELELSEERVTSSSLDVQLAPQADVWAESAGEGRPLPYVWQMEQGKGRILYWNTLLLHEKLMRGPFLQTMLKAQGGGGKLMVGGQVWFIDDFPSPAYNRISEGNRTGMTDFKFRLHRWDPDMQTIAQKHGLRYSCGVIFIYNEQVEPPFAFRDEEFVKLFEFETGLVGETGELGLHGYNHLSLNLSYTPEQKETLGYREWPSESAMEEALGEAKRRWREHVAEELPAFYIPPSNILSPEGKRALLRVYPDLKTISSLYQGTAEAGALVQEFASDPDFPDLMGTPRVTYGYSLNADQRHDLYGVLGEIGIVSHFNHPDDVFHEARAQGKTWEALRDSFDGLVGEVQGRFPFLQSLTATELADALRRYQAAEARIDRSQEGRLTAYVTPLSGPLFLEVRVEEPERWEAVQGGEIVARDGEHGLLWMKVTEPKAVLEVK